MTNGLASIKSNAVLDNTQKLAGGIAGGQLPAVDPAKRAAFDLYFNAAGKNPAPVADIAPPPPNDNFVRDTSRLNIANPNNNAGDTILNNLLGVNTQNETRDHHKLFGQIVTGYRSDNPVFVLDLQVALANLTINNLYQRKISNELNTQTKQIIQESQ